MTKILLILLTALMIYQAVAIYNCKKYVAFISSQPKNYFILNHGTIAPFEITTTNLPEYR